MDRPLAELVSELWRTGNKTEVNVDKKCMIDRCHRPAAVNQRGLCILCYTQAKKKVTAGEVTWERLEEMGLCEPKDDPFNIAYDKALDDSDAKERLKRGYKRLSETSEDK